MAYSGLNDFVNALEKKNEVRRIKSFVDPLLEITEITDRVTKSAGKALLFENNGTDFPVLINSFGSDKRMSMALGRENLDEAAKEIESIINNLSQDTGSILKKFYSLPSIVRLAGYLPLRIMGKGMCQEVIHKTPDLGIFPVLKCWPHDGGRFITLPMVLTIHPETGKSNVGMYRMQILDKNTTAMHWQRHKTGANHFEAWKRINKKMPVSVALGGDPVYTYAATAPLPENIDEFILAGFLRKKKVRMVKCLTNQLYVPYDADIVLEGYVDPAEEPVLEGPFGDHTGFYSLSDWYPKFHVICITHSKKAIYPATIVGIPPQEDSWLAKATERIFISPVKMTIMPEIVDFHMPDAGIAHNLVVVKINKTYPGQGLKVINSLLGAGQMMFTKYMVVVSGDIDLRNYKELLFHIFDSVDISNDLQFISGPLDVLDHSSDAFSFGGKLGVDATIKLVEEMSGRHDVRKINTPEILENITELFDRKIIGNYCIDLLRADIPILIITLNQTADPDIVDKTIKMFREINQSEVFRLIVAVDHTLDPTDFFTVAWQVLGNSDPKRDHYFISPKSILIDGTIKAFRKGGFSRRWPNIVCSLNETILSIDQKWASFGLGPLVHSPSLKKLGLSRNGLDEVIIN